jgi:hypothetical protein
LTRGRRAAKVPEQRQGEANVFALYVLVAIGSQQVGWTQTVTHVGDFKDKAACEAAAGETSFLPPPSGNFAPTFICARKP